MTSSSGTDLEERVEVVEKEMYYTSFRVYRFRSVGVFYFHSIYLFFGFVYLVCFDDGDEYRGYHPHSHNHTHAHNTQFAILFERIQLPLALPPTPSHIHPSPSSPHRIPELVHQRSALSSNTVNAVNVGGYPGLRMIDEHQWRENANSSDNPTSARTPTPTHPHPHPMGSLNSLISSPLNTVNAPNVGGMSGASSMSGMAGMGSLGGMGGMGGMASSTLWHAFFLHRQYNFDDEHEYGSTTKLNKLDEHDKTSSSSSSRPSSALA
ncbi:hypothetical protein EV360DRAFT_69643 [Lentinula raphanica]|nr:hypothetical protein EV360DRAFT_69643 [Lentinula raphanica]